MQLQRVQNNSYNQKFGATIKIKNNYSRKMEKNVIQFLQEEFPQKTKDIEGNLTVNINGDFAHTHIEDELVFENGNGFKDAIRTEVSLSDLRETLLYKFVSAVKAFNIRENAQNKINRLKSEIIEISDKAAQDSAVEFGSSYPLYKDAKIGINHDIDFKKNRKCIVISRNSN